MRTVLNILNFVLGGFATTLAAAGDVCQYCAYFYPAVDPLLLGDNQTVPVPLR